MLQWVLRCCDEGMRCSTLRATNAQVVCKDSLSVLTVSLGLYVPHQAQPLFLILPLRNITFNYVVGLLVFEVLKSGAGHAGAAAGHAGTHPGSLCGRTACTARLMPLFQLC